MNYTFDVDEWTLPDGRVVGLEVEYDYDGKIVNVKAFDIADGTELGLLPEDISHTDPKLVQWADDDMISRAEAWYERQNR